MNILIAIVHYWNPNGDGRHQSTRPDPQPRINALQYQILCLRRIGYSQSVLHMQDKAVYRINDAYRNNITIKIITDGTHHVLDLLESPFHTSFEHIAVQPSDPKMLGFEAHKALSSHINENFDYYCYLEDDLLINDPTFFQKLSLFNSTFDSSCLLLPHRIELANFPSHVDRFYIDGPIIESELRALVPESGPVRQINFNGFSIPFEPPLNPHAGCFFLAKSQFRLWIDHPTWLDFDTSFVSPLESAATLGISKVFTLFKTCMSHAAWFEIQHYGTSFHSLIVPPNLQ